MQIGNVAGDNETFDSWFLSQNGNASRKRPLSKIGEVGPGGGKERKKQRKAEAKLAQHSKATGRAADHTLSNPIVVGTQQSSLTRHQELRSAMLETGSASPQDTSIEVPNATISVGTSSDPLQPSNVSGNVFQKG